MKTPGDMALDRVHLRAQVDTLVVTAMENGLDEEQFIELARAQWRDVVSMVLLSARAAERAATKETP